MLSKNKTTSQSFINWLVIWCTFTLFSILRNIIIFRGSEFVIQVSFSQFIDTLISGGYTLFLLSLPLLFFKWPLKKYFLLVSILPVFSNLINYIHIFQYKTPVTMGAFAVMFESNPQEASEFFQLINPQTLILSTILALLPLTLLFTFLNKKNNSKQFLQTSIILSIFLSSTVFAGVKGSITNHHWSYQHHSFTNSFLYNDAKRIAYYLREKQKLKKAVETRRDINAEAFQSLPLDTIPQTFVLVLGESSAKGHWGLYGYYRNTTPHLDTISNLLLFDNVIAPATQTRAAMMLLLTPATVNNLNAFYSSPSIINIANAAGFETFWLSNQMKFGISDTQTSVIANDANHVKFINTDWNTTSLDERLIPELKSALEHQAKKKFIVLHTLGSHHAYEKRYPHTDFFTVKDSLINPGHWTNLSIKATATHYDNSILYTSFVLSEIIRVLKQSDNQSTMLYLSDHGQEVYDRPGLGMGHGSPRLSKEVVEVPFFIWQSKKNKINQTYLTRQFSSQHLFHALIDLMEIETNSYQPQNSLFDTNFEEEPRKILSSENKVIDFRTIE